MKTSETYEIDFVNLQKINEIDFVVPDYITKSISQSRNFFSHYAIGRLKTAGKVFTGTPVTYAAPESDDS